MLQVLRRWVIVSRSAALMAIVSLLISSLGAPPLPGSKDHSSIDRYPCDGGSCGCRSAEECWTHCCCMTVAQRLAWTIRNGLTPPAYAKFTDAQWAAARVLVAPAVARSCCAERAEAQKCVDAWPDATATGPWLTPGKCKGATAVAGAGLMVVERSCVAPVVVRVPRPSIHLELRTDVRSRSLSPLLPPPRG